MRRLALPLLLICLLVADAQTSSDKPTSVTRTVNTQSEATQPFYRLKRNDLSKHFYTTECQEVKNVSDPFGPYHFERIEGRLLVSGGLDKVPLTRLYNAARNDHIYSSDAIEVQNLNQQGYVTNKIEGYVYKYPTTGLMPLYRMSRKSDGRHMYTATRGEKDALSQQGYKVDKIDGYIYPPTTENEHVPACFYNQRVIRRSQNSRERWYVNAGTRHLFPDQCTIIATVRDLQLLKDVAVVDDYVFNELSPGETLRPKRVDPPGDGTVIFAPGRGKFKIENEKRRLIPDDCTSSKMAIGTPVTVDADYLDCIDLGLPFNAIKCDPPPLEQKKQYPQKTVCKRDAPSGWVIIGIFSSAQCGEPLEDNQYVVADVSGARKGDVVYVCGRTITPDGWEEVGSRDPTSPCGFDRLYRYKTTLQKIR
jgi:uncharacterized protein DUF5648